MKDYNKVAAKILKIVKANIVQCGSPTCYNSVNLRIQITEPYIIGYVFYVVYNGIILDFENMIITHEDKED